MAAATLKREREEETCAGESTLYRGTCAARARERADVDGTGVA
jgi:hypothetical protein